MLRKLSLSLLPFAVIGLFTNENMSDNGRAGFTGSPGELNCTDCHSSFALNSGGGSVSIQSPGMPAWEYTPGTTYNMSVTVSRTGNVLFGVGIEALTSSNANGGTLNITDAASTQIKTRTVSSVVRRNVVHQLNGGSGIDSKVFNFSWTAPAAGTGTITFYFAGVASNNNTNENGDYVYTGSQVITELTCQAPAQPGIITGNASLCSNTQSVFYVDTISGATSYNWVLPPGWNGTSTTNAITLTSGITSGTISVMANNSCGSSPARTFNVNIISIDPGTSISQVSCNGAGDGSASLTPVGGTGPYTYSWSRSGETTSTISGLIPGNYTVLLTDFNGCTQSASFQITEPAVLSTGVTQTDVHCNGGADGTISAIVTGGNPVYSYSWNSVPPQSGATATGLMAGNYTVVVTDSRGCSGSASALLSEPPLLVAAAGPDAILCAGSTVDLGGTPAASGGSGTYTYLWDPIYGLLNPADANPVLTGISSTPYTLNLTDGNGCTASASANIVVNPLPAPGISMSGDTLFTTGSYTFQWYYYSNVLSNATDSFYVPFQNGDYTVHALDLNGCEGVSTIYSFTAVGIPGDLSQGILSIYPNPASNTITVHISDRSQPVVFRICDVSGRMVLETALENQLNAVDVSFLAKGFYTLVIETGQNKICKRLSIVR